MINAIIFDVGGVIAYDVWEHMLLDQTGGIAARCQLDPQQVQQAGLELWEAFAYRSDKPWKELEQDYWALFVQRFPTAGPVDPLIQLTERFIRPVEGMSQLLADLRATGLIIAICSNATEFWFERQMNKLGLRPIVDENKVILSSRVGFPKNSPGSEMFYAAVRATGVKKDQCLFVDDRPENIKQAAQVGLSSILFPSHADYGARYLRLLLGKMKLLKE
jgi:HAD superfamily hydrolase (TIGR01509 family)